MSPPRLIAGNLDCERDYAGLAGGLPGPVAHLASALATLLRALAAPGDRLWTPRPVEPERVVALPELPPIRLESGPLEDAAPAPQVLAWGETSATALLRRGELPAAQSDSLIDRLWALPRADPAAAARANHRRLAFELGRELGFALPGARVIASREELVAHLRAGGARAGRGAWVVKAPHGAAGRERLLRRGSDLRPDVAVRIDRLIAHHGELIFEPWVERREDYGICGMLAAGRATLYPAHRLRCDRQGVVRGVIVDDDAGAAPPDVARELERVAREAARALERAGYQGPFNVDAFRFADDAKEAKLQPICEINARLSFGFVARALGERLAPSRGLSAGRLELRLDGADAGRPGIELLRPGARDGAAAILTW